MQQTQYDVIVIGGGPAGMMAASTAAKGGARTLLLEKNPHLGKKLLITGGGRCNVTNNKPVVREMLSQYKTEGKFLFSTFMQHGVSETLQWLEERGVKLKEENEGRLFPASNSAQTIRDVLAAELQATGVEVRLAAAVQTIEKKEGFLVRLQTGEVVQSARCIVATGGSARPETGSTGEGIGWLQQLGHRVVESSFALVPVTLQTQWTKKLSGLTLEECKITILVDGEKQSSHKGKILFTHFGLTGPTVLNLSKKIGELLPYGEVVLALDVFPGKDSGELNSRFVTLFTENKNKRVRNALGELLPSALGKGVLSECGIDAESLCNAITRAQRVALIDYLKAIPLRVSGLLGEDKAVVSAGGVVLEEVDFRTMESKITPGLFLVGDVLNINRPSGGYSLQLCWSTGFVAGLHAGIAS